MTLEQIYYYYFACLSHKEEIRMDILHVNCEQIYFILFFCLSHQEGMRSGTHFRQQNVFLLVSHPPSPATRN
jgi:hypothetical protein